MRFVVTLAALFVFVGACSGDEDPAPTAEPTTADSTVTETATAVPTSEATVAPTENAGPTPMEQGARAVSAGRYVTDRLPVLINVDLTEGYAFTTVLDGWVTIEDTTATAFTAVSLLETDALVMSTSTAAHTGRLPVGPDLGPWVAGLEHSQLAAEGEGSIGNLEARWWTIEDARDCPGCFSQLFQLRGGRLWAVLDDTTQKIWSVETAEGPLLVIVEGPSDGFDAWDAIATESVLDGLEFTATATGNSVFTPRGDHIGPYEVGRTETSVVDTTRPTTEVAGVSASGIVVEAADARELLVSVAYPAPAGGYDAAPAEGPFPLVLAAHALGGDGIVNPADYALASHGYVVAHIRFPESSRPGESIPGVNQQPADVSAVLDAVLGQLPASLASVIDADTVGLVGYSLGATTSYGVIGSSCCSDSRVGAAIAHAGPAFDFTDGLNWAHGTPLLLVGSEQDQTTTLSELQALHEEIPTPSFLLSYREGEHLAWLDEASANFPTVVQRSVEFFDHYLKNDGPLPTPDLDPASASWSVNGLD